MSRKTRVPFENRTWTNRTWFRRSGSADVRQFKLGDQHRDSKRWLEAADAYTQGLKEMPQAFPYWVQLGHALKEAGQLRRSEEAYLRGHELRPDDADLLVQLGHFYKLTNRPVKALDFYERALKAGTSDLHAVVALADAARDRSDWLTAASLYRKRVDAEPTAADYWIQYGNMLKEAGLHHDAEAAYIRVLNLDEHKDEAHLRLGQLYALQRVANQTAMHPAPTFHASLLDAKVVHTLMPLLAACKSAVCLDTTAAPVTFARLILDVTQPSR